MSIGLTGVIMIILIVLAIIVVCLAFYSTSKTQSKEPPTNATIVFMGYILFAIFLLLLAITIKFIYLFKVVIS